MLQDLAPLVGRRLSLGVVPNWGRKWPLAGHPEYCRLIQGASDELLLHGYFHQRQRGWGPTSLLAERCDEMNGLNRDETKEILERGQQVFTEVFGAPARGFLAPGWQRGHVRRGVGGAVGLEHTVGFFALESSGTPSVPLATWTWDCGRWGWLGHIGAGIGRLRNATSDAVPTLAVHPRDIARGYWPRILQLTRKLLEKGYEPTTSAALVKAA